MPIWRTQIFTPFFIKFLNLNIWNSVDFSTNYLQIQFRQNSLLIMETQLYFIHLFQFIRWLFSFVFNILTSHVNESHVFDRLFPNNLIRPAFRNHSGIDFCFLLLKLISQSNKCLMSLLNKFTRWDPEQKNPKKT